MPRKNKIIIRTGTTDPVATDFVTGEPAYNSNTSAFYIKNSAGAMAQIGSGVFTASLGSASAPSLTFTGDTNTGVYSPGADQVSIVTGGVARLTVNASGRSLARANNERYAVGSAYSATSGFVYFGANNESATPDAVISGAGGGALMTLMNSGVIGVGLTNPALSSGIGIHTAGSTMRLAQSRTPASATATGNTGEICWDASYVYVCTATNTWRRSAISSW
jgi:hypothetical protein